MCLAGEFANLSSHVVSNTQLRWKPTTILQSDVAADESPARYKTKINFYSIIPITLKIVIDAITFAGILFCAFPPFQDAEKMKFLEFLLLLIFPLLLLCCFSFIISRGNERKKQQITLLWNDKYETINKYRTMR